MMDNLSFSGVTKAELSKIKPTGCCRRALCYGLLLFGRSFCKTDISIKTESLSVAEIYTYLLKLCFNAHTLTEKKGDKRISYTVSVPGEADRNKIVNFFDFGEADWILNPKYVKRNCCRWSFIKGAFLACGSINDPEKGYHLEFAVKDPTLSFAFSAFLELCGHKPKRSSRQNVTALYYNNSTDIEDILANIGADGKSLEIMQVKVVRDMRNRLNRQNNFETSNIGKTASAAVMQNEAVSILEKTGKIKLLPEELIKAAMLRKENPDASLSVLCKLSGENITRSGMNHRLQRIIDAADGIKHEKKFKK